MYVWLLEKEAYSISKTKTMSWTWTKILRNWPIFSMSIHQSTLMINYFLTKKMSDNYLMVCVISWITKMQEAPFYRSMALWGVDKRTEDYNTGK